MAGVSKTFGGVRALSDVALGLDGGRVRALVGANGSGKSTLVKILAGYHLPEPGGTLWSHGAPAPFPAEARAKERSPLGVVHQDLGLIDDLSILENFLMPRFARRQCWAVNWRRAATRTAAVLERYGVADVHENIDQTPRVTRALVALARAVDALERGGSPAQSGLAGGVLILDEITAYLSAEEIETLRQVVRATAQRGHAVLFVSHDLGEVMSFADSVTVLRDGRIVAEREIQQTGPDELFELIAGRKREATLPVAGARADALHAIQVTDAGVVGAATSSFRVASGEVLGLTGLVGSGFEEMPYLLFGAHDDGVGTLRIDDEEVDLRRLGIGDAMAHGIALVPSERLKTGLIGGMSIAENVTMLRLPQFVERGRLKWGKVRAAGSEVIDRYRITAPSPSTEVSALSGGNQQRVLLAKWLESKPRLLVLHEPAQGIDVGARVEVARLVREHANGGDAIICASGDYEFLSQVCDRVLVYRGGTIVAELTRNRLEPRIDRDAIEWACIHGASREHSVERG